MMSRKKRFEKNTVLFALAALLMTGALQSCHDDPVEPALPEIAIAVPEDWAEFSYEGGQQTLTLIVNRDWTIQCDEDWLAFDYDESPVETGVTTEIGVTVTALPNSIGNVKNTLVRFKTSAVYADLYVSQAMNPDKAPELLYYNGFGKDLAGLSNPYIGSSDCWRTEEGASVESISYYAENEKITVRNSGSSNSDGAYDGASGANHIFFGTDHPALTISGIAVHPQLSALRFSFGVYNINNVSLDVSDFILYISKDGNSWVPLEYKTVSEYTEPKWSFCEGGISFAAGSFDTLYVRIDPGSPSTYRFDDLRIEAAEPAEDNVVDWTTGAKTFGAGNPVE